LLNIQTAKKFPGRAWQNYDSAFRKEAAATGLKDWSKMHADLYKFIPESHLPLPPSPNPVRLSLLTTTTDLHSFATRVNAGECKWPFRHGKAAAGSIATCPALTIPQLHPFVLGPPLSREPNVMALSVKVIWTLQRQIMTVKNVLHLPPKHDRKKDRIFCFC